MQKRLAARIVMLVTLSLALFAQAGESVHAIDTDHHVECTFCVAASTSDTATARTDYFKATPETAQPVTAQPARLVQRQDQNGHARAPPR